MVTRGCKVNEDYRSSILVTLRVPSCYYTSNNKAGLTHGEITSVMVLYARVSLAPTSLNTSRTLIMRCLSAPLFVCPAANAKVR